MFTKQFGLEIEFTGISREKQRKLSRIISAALLRLPGIITIPRKSPHPMGALGN